MNLIRGIAESDPWAGTAMVFQWWASKVGRLIQTSDKAQPTRLGDEIKDTVFGFGWVVAAIAAWPMARAEVLPARRAHTKQQQQQQQQKQQ